MLAIPTPGVYTHKMFDLYRANQRDTCRFVLGTAGARPLFVVGLNPSTANREKSDVTATKVAHVARAEGYDGFVMTNLYPRRSTCPDNLPLRADSKMWQSNLDIISELARCESRPQFWAAWGADIGKRRYLARACQSLADNVADMGGSWWSFGPVTSGPAQKGAIPGGLKDKGLLTKKGHPRHPSRLNYEWSLQRFDIQRYLGQLD